MKSQKSQVCFLNAQALVVAAAGVFPSLSKYMHNASKVALQIWKYCIPMIMQKAGKPILSPEKESHLQPQIILRDLELFFVISSLLGYYQISLLLTFHRSLP